MYAEVAVPIYVHQTFTYCLPDALAGRAQIGARVVVPFAKKLLTGFIVALVPQADPAIDLNSIKDVQDLVDESPVVTPDILNLTHWISEYYYAPWGESLRAALPAGSMIVADNMLTATDAGRAAYVDGASDRITTRNRVLQVILASGSISSRDLEKELSASGIKRPATVAMIRRLEREGCITISHRLGESRLRPKLQSVVRLAETDNSEPGDQEGTHESTPDGASAETHESPTADSANGKLHRRRPATGAAKPARKLTEPQRRVLDFLEGLVDPVPVAEVVERTRVAGSVIRTLQRRGLVDVSSREVRRDPLAHLPMQDTLDQMVLTPEQQGALTEILRQTEAKTFAPFLLHGVTGSGKTEIYLRAIHDTIRRGCSALMLVPEISLTPVFSRRLRDQFGGLLAMIHSSMSEGERVDEWRRIREGEARVVIGTRSAVFAPLQTLGLVIVDEEHDNSYRQDESPQYHGRDTAVMRASMADAVVILGSATPSVESYFNAKAGKYSYLRLEARYGNRPLAEVQTVDMREVFKREGKQQTLSAELKTALGEAFERREQSMVLLNRRGFSSFLLCRSCGQAVQCVNCAVTLTFHKYNSSLQCHYCNYIRPVPASCPSCEGQYIHYVGEGTEQIEARLKALFPQMRIARLDRDTTRRRGSYEHILMEFAEGAIDLLVGTQMIAKGHDFPNVTMVGVISVDGGLSLPDFRSAERTFQLLTQVAGRAGRGSRRGRVIIQTYHPDHYSVVTGMNQDYEGFYNQEINFRRMMHFPPYRALINVRVHDKEFEKASQGAALIARALREFSNDPSVKVLGPAPAPLARLKGEHRFQVLIKATSRRLAREALDFAMLQASTAGINPRSVSVDVDPLNLM